MQWICLLTSGGWQNKFKVWLSHIVDHKVRFKLKTIYTHVIYNDLQMSLPLQFTSPSKSILASVIQPPCVGCSALLLLAGRLRDRTVAPAHRCSVMTWCHLVLLADHLVHANHRQQPRTRITHMLADQHGGLRMFLTTGQLDDEQAYWAVQQQQTTNEVAWKKHSALQRSLTNPSCASRSAVCSLDMQSWCPAWRYNHGKVPLFLTLTKIISIDPSFNHWNQTKDCQLLSSVHILSMVYNSIK